jgi:hypothetical protein
MAYLEVDDDGGGDDDDDDMFVLWRPTPSQMLSDFHNIPFYLHAKNN